MNILITGGSGFIGKSIAAYLLKDNYNVYNPSHYELDILDYLKLDKFIEQNQIQLIIHTAITGHKYGQKDTLKDFNDNMTMWNNIKDIANKFKCYIINFGSGAEFDMNTHIRCKAEKEIFNCLPRYDYYGLSKNLITRDTYWTDRAITLRIFNCFGVGENVSRFITQARTKPSVTIENDKYFDFFYIGDLYKVINYIILNYRHVFKSYLDINCVYPYPEPKRLLSEVAQLCGNKNIIIKNRIYDRDYTGDGSILKTLGIQFDGLEKGINQL